MQRQLGSLALALALVLALCARAQAAPDKAGGSASRTVMLPVEGEAVPSLADEIMAASKELKKKVEPASLGMEDLQLAVGCGTLSVKCLQKIGKTLKAGTLLLVKQRKRSGEAAVSLRLVNVNTGANRNQVAVSLSLDPIARRPRLRDALAKLFGVTFKPGPGAKPTGTLSIDAAVSNVEIEIDGQPRGTLPLSLERFPVGKHKLVARRLGYHDWRGEVEVRKGQTARVRVSMERDPDAAPRRGFWRSIRAPTWIVAGVGLASFGVAAAFGAHMISQQNKFDDNSAVTLGDLQRMQDLRDTGDRDALVANVMFAVGGAAMVAAVVMSYIDYRRGGSSEEPQPGAPALRTKTKATLQLGPGAVGLRITY